MTKPTFGQYLIYWLTKYEVVEDQEIDAAIDRGEEDPDKGDTHD